MAEKKPQVIGSSHCLWCHERLFMTIPHHCKEMDELPSKSEEHVTTTEQNTKQDTEWRRILHKSLYEAGFKILEPRHPLYVVVVEEVIRSLLASQRHQLKEQVLEVVGTEEDESKANFGEILSITTRNKFRSELRERIKVVFEKGKR